MAAAFHDGHTEMSAALDSRLQTLGDLAYAASTRPRGRRSPSRSACWSSSPSRRCIGGPGIEGRIGQQPPTPEPLAAVLREWADMLAADEDALFRKLSLRIRALVGDKD